LPLGFGPLQFGSLFGGDPHNVYLNAFASYGWLGGISYILLILATMAAGWKAIFTRTPWQHHAIAVFCPLFTTILQGIQIDTDHWRHFYLLLGLIWGLYEASAAYRPHGETTAHGAQGHRGG
jgi:O-antigen ligase